MAEYRLPVSIQSRKVCQLETTACMERHQCLNKIKVLSKIKWRGNFVTDQIYQVSNHSFSVDAWLLVRKWIMKTYSLFLSWFCVKQFGLQSSKIFSRNYCDCKVAGFHFLYRPLSHWRFWEQHTKYAIFLCKISFFFQNAIFYIWPFTCIILSHLTISLEHHPSLSS